MKEKAKETQTKMAKLEERATQQEVQLGRLEGELAHKVELFKQLRKSSPAMSLMLMVLGLKMP